MSFTLCDDSYGEARVRIALVMNYILNVLDKTFGRPLVAVMRSLFAEYWFAMSII